MDIDYAMLQKIYGTGPQAEKRYSPAKNGFSKKLENHAAAVALHYMHYNFARIHKTLRVTPATRPASRITCGRSKKSSGRSAETQL